MNLMDSLASQFGWGSLVNLVTVYTSSGLEDKSILYHRKAISVRDAQAQEWTYFSDGYGSCAKFNETKPLMMLDIDAVCLETRWLSFMKL